MIIVTVDALFFFHFLLIPLSRRILYPILFPGNKHDRLETTTQCAEWSPYTTVAVKHNNDIWLISSFYSRKVSVYGFNSTLFGFRSISRRAQVLYFMFPALSIFASVTLSTSGKNVKMYLLATFSFQLHHSLN